MEQTRIVVGGLGRCGSSLMMQMLSAAGVPCIGEFPSFEDGRLQFSNTLLNVPLVQSHPGHAFKCLDWGSAWQMPEEVRPFVLIWMTRRAREQGDSMVKFIQTVTQSRLPQGTAGKMARRCIRDDRASMEMMAKGCKALLRVHFGHVIEQPGQQCERIADWAGKTAGITLDAKVMAACMKPRSPRCARDMSIEMELLQEAERRRMAAVV